MSIRIGFGIAGFPFSSTAAFFRWVDRCEASAVDSIWFSERLVSTALTLEPMIAMAHLAGRTERLKFGMNAIVLPLRDPLVLGTVLACYGVPRTALIPLGGVLADRIGPRRLMLGADVARCLLAVALTVLAARHLATLAWLAPVAALLGAGAGMFMPASFIGPHAFIISPNISGVGPSVTAAFIFAT